MDLKEFGDRRIVIETEGSEFSIITESGDLEFQEGATKDRTGTVRMPKSLAENPSKIGALWHLLTGNLESYCHIDSCPNSDEGDRCPIMQVRSCEECGYTFRHALKMIDLLNRR